MADLIEMVCTEPMRQGAGWINPGERIAVEGALWAGKLQRSHAAELVNASDLDAVTAALARDDARKVQASKWRRQ